MILTWRLCRASHAALDGEGARRFGGRWNSLGRRVVYLADHPALAVLEVVVHLDVPVEDLPDDYVMLRVGWPDDMAAAMLQSAGDSCAVGDAWLDAGHTAFAWVPSAIVPQAQNILLNPLHVAAAQARVQETVTFRFDPRLLRTI